MEEAFEDEAVFVGVPGEESEGSEVEIIDETEFDENESFDFVEEDDDEVVEVQRNVKSNHPVIFVPLLTLWLILQVLPTMWSSEDIMELPHKAHSPSLVIATDLTEFTFADFVAEHDQMVVAYYAPWCPVSNEFLSIWDDLALSVKLAGSARLGVAAVDCASQRRLCAKIEAYPTIVSMYKGQVRATFDDFRTVDRLLDFIDSRIELQEPVKNETLGLYKVPANVTLLTGKPNKWVASKALSDTFAREIMVDGRPHHLSVLLADHAARSAVVPLSLSGIVVADPLWERCETPERTFYYQVVASGRYQPKKRARFQRKGRRSVLSVDMKEIPTIPTKPAKVPMTYGGEWTFQRRRRGRRAIAATDKEEIPVPYGETALTPHALVPAAPSLITIAPVTFSSVVHFIADEASLAALLLEHERVFVNFFYCRDCSDPVPQWKQFASSLLVDGISVAVAAVNCQETLKFCMKQSVDVLPALRWYYKGQQNDYYFGKPTMDGWRSFVDAKIVA